MAGCEQGTGQCLLIPEGASCNSCTGDAAFTGTCMAGGQCGGQTTGCLPYQCGASACKTSCAADSDCTSGYFCWSSKCVGIHSVATGYSHACALASGGDVQCWGRGDQGQVGDGTMALSNPSPVAVSGVSLAIAIGAGDAHSCALTLSGAVSCWGSNSNGQLGNGSSVANAPTPVQVTGMTSGVTAIGLGDRETCAVQSGGVWCWGDNQYGQLGNGSTTDSSVPVPVTGLSSGVTAVSVGMGGSVCARLATGAVSCWGLNAAGQLGNGTTANSSVPVAVSGLTTATSISVGYQYACVVTASKYLACWGANSNGQFGNGTTTSSLVPTYSFQAVWAAVAAGGYSGGEHTCGVSGNTVQCWGYNGAGELGNGSLTQSLVPVDTGLLGVSDLKTSSEISCAASKGLARCWGLNTFGQLGTGSTTPAQSSVPTVVTEP